MNILITGGSGFLGARLARTLLQQGKLSKAGAAAAPITSITLADRAAAAGRPGGGPARQGRRRRPAGPGDLARAAGRRHRRGVPPRRRRQRRMRGRLRPGHAQQLRRHAPAAGSLPRAGLSPRVRVCQFAGGIRQAAGPADARTDHRRDPAHAAEQLRHPEIHRRAAGRRLRAQGLHHGPQRAADDRERAPGPPQRRGLRLPVAACCASRWRACARRCP